jgi:hypothetical protein
VASLPAAVDRLQARWAGEAMRSAVSSASVSSNSASARQSKTEVQLPAEVGEAGHTFERHHSKAQCHNRASTPCPARRG